jgi:hypothetical protein
LHAAQVPTAVITFNILAGTNCYIMEFSRISTAIGCKYFLKYDKQYISAFLASEMPANLGTKPNILLENNLQIAPKSFVQNLGN